MTKMLGVQEEPAIYKVLASRVATERRSLRSLGRWSGGGTPSKSNPTFWSGGTIPWVSPKDMKLARISDAEDHITPEAVARSATSLIKAGAVVLVVRSGILQHSLPVAVTDVDVALNQDLKALQPSAGVDATYVAWALRAHAQAILRLCTKAGTTVQSIEMPALLDYEIPLPSAERQREVVETVEARLSVLDASVAALHRVKANLKRYRASVLKSACEGRLVPTEAELARQEGRSFETGAELLQRILAERKRAWMGKRSYVEPDPVASEEQAPVPDGWAWAALDELAWHSSYGTSAKCSPTATGAAVLRIPNVDRGNIDTTNMKYSAETLDAESTAALKAGDMLIIRTNGSKALIGRGAIVQAPFSAPTTFASYLIRFRLVREIHQEWLGLFWQSPESRGWIEARASTSAGQHNVSMSVLATAPVPLPPLAEQHRIVAEADRRLSLIRVAEAQVSANLARAHRLRQSILQAAFRTPAQARQ